MTRGFVATLSVLLPLCVVPFVGCSDSGDDDTGASSGHSGLEGYEDVAYEGATTDEALISLVSGLENGTTADPAKAATLDNELLAVPKGEAPTFTWHIGPEARRAAPRDRRLAAVPPPTPWPEPVLLQTAVAPRPGTFLERALEAALSGVRSAHAHGDPFNGYGTLLTVSSDSDAKVARVFTGATSWTPSASVWQSIVDAGDAFTVTLVGAEFEENRLPQGTGVYEGSTTTFTVAP